MKFQSNSIFNGTITANSVADAGTNTDKFLVLNSSGVVTYRTAAELYADLGVGSSGAAYTSVLKHPVKAGEAINKGQAVYVSSSNGTNMIVSKASNAIEASSSKTIGLLETTLANNSIGNVITEGLLAGLDTTGATNAGDPVWLGTGGNLIYGLINKPYAPANLVFIGIVTRINANNGEIFVKVQNGFELQEIHDVDLITTTPVNGHILGYNGTLWVNKTIAGWLGFTPVTNARTLTINGTAYDLSADRSWTIDSTSASTRTIQKFTATSGQTTFTITGGYAVGMVDVYMNGVKLDNATDFTASNGTTVVLAAEALINSIIEVYKFGSQFIPNNALRVVTSFTATAAQTTFTVNYSVGLVDVFYNGSNLAQSEYTATNGTSIILATACQVNDIVVVYAYSYSVGAYSGIGGSGTINTLPKFTAASTIGNSAITDDGTTVTLVSRALSGTSATFSGTATATAFIPSGSSVPTNGMYLSAANTLDFATNTTNRLSISSTGVVTANGGLRTTGANGYSDTDGTSTIFVIANISSSVPAVAVTTNHPLAFYTNNTEKMRLTAVGSLCVGSTASFYENATRSSLSLAGSTDSIINFQNKTNTESYTYLYSDDTANHNFYIQNTTANGNLLLATNSTVRMTIQSDGRIIKAADNTTTGQFQLGGQTGSPPNAILVVAADQNAPYPMGVKSLFLTQGLVGFFDSSNAVQGSISIASAIVSYNSFMGSHYSQFKNNDKPEIYKGTILEAIDELCEWEEETNDRLAKVKISDTIESKNVYGIFLDWDNSDEFNDMLVAALGASYIRVNKNEIISMGDLLQSNGDGTAKVQSDDIMRSSTIAKVVSTNKIETYEDGSYLIAVTLHCG